MQNYVATTRLLKAIIMEPEWVVDMYWTDAKLAMEMCERMMRAGLKFDGAFLFYDLGYKNGLLFFPKHYEQQLHHVFKELCRFFHSREMLVLLHSCGNVKEPHTLFHRRGY